MLYDILRLPRVLLTSLYFSQDKAFARIKTIGDMFVLKNIPHLITHDLCAVYLCIDVCVRVTINPRINATVCYKLA